MKLRHPIAWVVLLTIAGCSLFQEKETVFLRTAQDHATQEEVKQQLGPPKAMTTSQSGESLWIYQLWTWQPGDWRVTAAGTWCDEYVLTFDSQAILRHWTHNTYFHGGEAFPKYCVPDRYDSTVLQ